MFTVTVSQVGNVAILHCRGRLVRSDAAFALRDMVVAQMAKDAIVLDLAEVDAIEGGGVGMLVFLKRWCEDNGINLTAFNPSPTVLEKMDRIRQAGGLPIASEGEILKQITREHLLQQCLAA